jgi:hypothetical protein
MSTKITKVTTSGDGAIHSWFGLSYTNYLVLPRTLLQSMPHAWQDRFVDNLRELSYAFDHVKQADRYTVQAAKEKEICELNAVERKLADVEVVEHDEDNEDEDEDEFPRYYHKGELADADYRVYLPILDPIPPYNRGRTRIEREEILPEDQVLSEEELVAVRQLSDCELITDPVQFKQQALAAIDVTLPLLRRLEAEVRILREKTNTKG